MDKIYKEPTPSKIIALIGDNFVVKHIYNSFKRYSKQQPFLLNTINELNGNFNYIIDCTFNKKHQDNTIKYIEKNIIEKVIIINHWKRNLPVIDNTSIIQLILPDIYGDEHDSFSRSGSGNNFDDDVNYCTLICESIRRIHDNKIGFIPNTYINYGESKVKYIHVDNIYKPIQYVIDTIDNNIEFEIYDEEKNVTEVLYIIKDILDYNGNIIFNDTESNYNNSIKKLKFKYNYKSLHNNIKNIYNNLIRYNDRFKIY